MASTASDLIKFEKMATGEKSGTWGTLANVAMSRIEEAVAGYRAITLAGSTYVLDDTQYLENSTTTAESHLAIIKATGTPGASRQITVPLRSKIYLIWNAVTTYDLTVAGASGDSVTITNGNMAWVMCDGTNVEFASPLFTSAGVLVGFGTSDSPQFTGIELGAASDTTVTRASAGNMNIEGNLVYRAGGTDVPLADGGTGASTAAAAATALGVGTGSSPQFAAVNVGAATDTTITRVSAGLVAVEGSTVATLAPVQTFVAAQRPTVTALSSSSAAIAITLAASNDFSHTFTEDTTLSNPADTAIAGQKGSIYLTQHASSPKTLAFGSEYDFVGGTAPTVTAANNARDTLDYRVRADGKIEIQASLNYS